MKHARPDYAGIQDTTGRIPPDEPVFVLRATDMLAPGTIRHWAHQANANGAERRIVDAAMAQADAMEAYQKEHGRKVPDMPEERTGEGSLILSPSAPAEWPKLLGPSATWESYAAMPGTNDGRILVANASGISLPLPAWAKWLEL